MGLVRRALIFSNQQRQAQEMTAKNFGDAHKYDEAIEILAEYVEIV